MAPILPLQKWLVDPVFPHVSDMEEYELSTVEYLQVASSLVLKAKPGFVAVVVYGDDESPSTLILLITGGVVSEAIHCALASHVPGWPVEFIVHASPVWLSMVKQ